MNYSPATLADPQLPDQGWVRTLLDRQATSPGSTRVELVRNKLRTARLDDLLREIEIAKPTLNLLGEIELYKTWIDLNSGPSPHVFIAWLNLGIALKAAGDTQNAATAYTNALAWRPDFFHAAVNLGLLREAEGQTEAALQTWRKALQAKPDRGVLLSHCGRLLETQKRFAEAEAAYRESLLEDPTQAGVIQHWLRTRQTLCRWPLYESDIPGLSPETIIQNAGPMSVLALHDDIAIQLRVANEWLTRLVDPAPSRLSPETGYQHDRIRVGYVSSDFCKHAMGYLIAELFERHDRSQFEVYGYCSSREDGSDIRKRIVASFDRYVSVRDMTDEQLAHTIRAHEIDVLIDLNGITHGARLHTLRWKPAPVQITYLGYIGSVPLPELDYMLCDAYVVPPAVADSYAPKPLYLPTIFQANDTRPVADKTLTRADADLPDDAFVFCCLSDHYKITEEMFDAWLGILKRAPRAVLWLLRDNEWSCTNLTERAVAQGVDPARLLFAERVDPDVYMARLRLADVFLATFPYNPGTMASDALRMGLPVLTIAGQSFVARMAARLLAAIGAEAGIATDMADYVEKAVTVATDRAAYDELRRPIEGDAWRRTIGNIERFTAEMEDTLRAVVKRG